jgi:hypothetical protein
MNRRGSFLVIFLCFGLITKALSECVHEVLGHGLFVLVFGGTITRVHISLLWPYTLSGIGYDPPHGGFLNWQTPWVHGGGILLCLLVTLVLQTLLYLRRIRDPRLAFILFWLSFWTFLNPTGYLIMGGMRPFGDIWQLITAGVLTQASSIGLGLLLFLVGFFALSTIFRDVIVHAGIIENIRELDLVLSLFWLVIPLTTVLALMGLPFLGSSWFIAFPISFIPSFLAYNFSSIARWTRTRWRG